MALTDEQEQELIEVLGHLAERVDSLSFTLHPNVIEGLGAALQRARSIVEGNTRSAVAGDIAFAFGDPVGPGDEAVRGAVTSFAHYVFVRDRAETGTPIGTISELRRGLGGRLRLKDAKDMVDAFRKELRVAS